MVNKKLLEHKNVYHLLLFIFYVLKKFLSNQSEFGRP